jgi:spore maturation protein CgeB
MRHVAPPDHPGFYCSSALTLNITRAAMAEMGHCPSGRLFEAAACATPIISDWWEGLDAFFERGREILIASSTEDVLAVLSQDPAALEDIGRAARARVLRDHTAVHRARELAAYLEMRPTRPRTAPYANALGVS